MSFINVYTDGACSNNGAMNAKAGYGVYFTKDNKHNEYGRVLGKQSNNTGELMGFIRAIEITIPDIKNKITVNIYTDSEYVIKCMKSYCEKLQKNDWKTSTNKTPPNLELIQKAYSLYISHKKYINLFHISAHTDNTDEHSLGNKEADRLANLAIDIDILKVPQKYYINISFSQKDDAKLLGAKWDQNAKKWYYMDDIDENNKKQLKIMDKEEKPIKVFEENNKNIEKIYVKIAFQKKGEAKKNGARWDPEKKSWYYTSDLSIDKIDIIKNL